MLTLGTSSGRHTSYRMRSILPDSGSQPPQNMKCPSSTFDTVDDEHELVTEFEA